MHKNTPWRESDKENFKETFFAQANLRVAVLPPQAIAGVTKFGYSLERTKGSRSQAP
jgi:hypothetical protein